MCEVRVGGVVPAVVYLHERLLSMPECDVDAADRGHFEWLSSMWLIESRLRWAWLEQRRRLDCEGERLVRDGSKCRLGCFASVRVHFVHGSALRCGPLFGEWEI